MSEGTSIVVRATEIKVEARRKGHRSRRCSATYTYVGRARLEELGHEKRLKAYIVNYADDFVICCRSRAAEAQGCMRVMMSKLKLTVNEAKTRVCQLPEERFDFLGYTFGRCYSPRTGRAYLGATPSRKRVQRILSRDQRRDPTQHHPTGPRDDREDAQSDDDRVGELLLPRLSQQSLSCDRATCSRAAASVAVRQA